MLREAKLAGAFIEIADTLVAEFGVVDLLTVVADHCVDILDVAAAGVMLADSRGELHVAASSSEAMRVLELFELQAQEGPCPESFRTGNPVVNLPLSEREGRWPKFTPRAVQAGFGAVHAFPMRLRNNVIGALNLFSADHPGLSPEDVAAAQSLADMATIAILQQRAAANVQEVNDQLTGALASRVVIEQAKGIVAERSQLPMEQAFGMLRSYARNNQLRLDDVARSVIDGTLKADLMPVPQA